MKGKLITICGVDGAGKSSLIPVILEEMEKAGLEVVQTREPGGTPLGEKLRQLVLTDVMDAPTEALIMFAARNEHIRQIIDPALALGRWVLSDRFTDASFAYQGGGRGLGHEAVAELERWIGAPRPDLTFFFDVPLEIAKERLARNRDMDRFEVEGQKFFQRVREGYLARIEADPGRFVVIDSSLPLVEVQAQVRARAAAAIFELLMQQPTEGSHPHVKRERL